jgi:hypothetical protein
LAAGSDSIRDFQAAPENWETYIVLSQSVQFRKGIGK